LITSSILSKKLAANLDALVMDVKFGDAAFMKTVDDARLLADTLVDVGDEAGLPTRVIVSDMDQPLGFAVGNAIEVNEAVEVLRGSGPGCVRRLTLELGSELLVQVKLSEDRSQARGRLAEALDSGRALERFEAMVAAQGGQPRFPLPLPPRHDIVAGRDGYVSQFDCQAIGRAIVSMGGGRRRIEDPINPAIGLLVLPKIGDRVQRGQPLLALHADAETARPQLPRLNQAVRIVDQPVDSRPLIVHRG
jgi:thymidine phosphorylase